MSLDVVDVARLGVQPDSAILKEKGENRAKKLSRRGTIVRMIDVKFERDRLTWTTYADVHPRPAEVALYGTNSS